MSEEERQAIIHLLDKQARYEYAKNSGISFSDEDYEAYIIRHSMIRKDKEIKQLNNEIKQYKEYIKELKDSLINYHIKNNKLINKNEEKDKEIERLNNILKDIKSQLDYLETYSSKEDVFEDMRRRLDRIESIVNRK